MKASGNYPKQTFNRASGWLRHSAPVNHFGFQLAKAEYGRAVFKMPVLELHKQIHRVVHGGVLAMLADTAGGFAAFPGVMPADSSRSHHRDENKFSGARGARRNQGRRTRPAAGKNHQRGRLRRDRRGWTPGQQSADDLLRACAEKVGRASACLLLTLIWVAIMRSGRKKQTG